MIKHEISPAVCSYIGELSKMINNKLNTGLDVTVEYESGLFKKLSVLNLDLDKNMRNLFELIKNAENINNLKEKANLYKGDILDKMNQIREIINSIEDIMPKSFWPYPTYDDILFSV